MSYPPYPRDRSSDSPLAYDMAGNTGATVIPVGWADRIPRAWIGMSGYLIAGVVLGLLLIVGLTMTRSDSTSTKSAAGVISDNVVRLHSNEIGASCWKGAAKSASAAKMTVSIEVGLDGKVRNAIAAGESPSMRSCVESHVKAWQFLPQATSSQMVLPFEVDPR